MRSKLVKFWYYEDKICLILVLQLKFSKNLRIKAQILVLRGQNLFNFGFTGEI